MTPNQRRILDRFDYAYLDVKRLFETLQKYTLHLENELESTESTLEDAENRIRKLEAMLMKGKNA